MTKSELFRAFYKAEDYHQGYYKLNKNQQYCKIIISTKISKAREGLSKYYTKWVKENSQLSNKRKY